MHSDELDQGSLFEPLSRSTNENLHFEISDPENILKLRKSLEIFYTKIQALLNQSAEGELALLAKVKEICFECAMANATDVTEMEDYLTNMAIFPQLAFVNNLMEIADKIHLIVNSEGVLDNTEEGVFHTQTFLIDEYKVIRSAGVFKTIVQKLESSLNSSIEFEMPMNDLSDTIDDYQERFTLKYFEFSQLIINIFKSLLSKFEA